MNTQVAATPVMEAPVLPLSGPRTLGLMYNPLREDGIEQVRYSVDSMIE